MGSIRPVVLLFPRSADRDTGHAIHERENPCRNIPGPQSLALIGWVALCFSAAGTGVLVSTGG